MKQAVVIGAGVGGAAAAALLAAEGYSVTVLEKNAYAGGRAAGYEREGFVCDMGVHYSGRGLNGPHGKVALRTGARLSFVKPDPFVRFAKDQNFCYLPVQFINPVTVIHLSRLVGFKWRNYPGIARAILKLAGAKTTKDVEPYDEMTLRDFLFQYTDDEEMHRVFDIFCGLLMVVPYHEASAGEFMWCFSKWAQSKSTSYPVGGFQAIPRAFLDAAARHGATVKYKQDVCGIRVNGHNRVLGVETKKKFYPADVVVSNAGIKRTLDLAGDGRFPPEYVKRVRGLKESKGGITVKYALDFKPTEVPVLFHYSEKVDFSKNLKLMEAGQVPSDPPLFIPSPTVADPGLAPKGRHILMCTTIVPEDLSASALTEKFLDELDKKMEDLFPRIRQGTVWKHRTNLDWVNTMAGGRGNASVSGIAQNFDQVGKNKPSPRTPIRGLYLVGCDAGGRGIGCDQASDSALNACAMITADMPL
ncbi:MAG: NAD(P)/FAD-dependent oxidoreductase [Deltaproteobacteria bacterium]|nr:NAD(P)/FAD-dependent oxidoreductase [Deltaproteobacteria bacterium]